MSSVLNQLRIPEDKEFDWPLFHARVFYWAAVCGTLGTMWFFVLPITARGLKSGFPTLAMGGGASFLAFMFVLAVPYFWTKILQSWLGSEGVFDLVGRNTENHMVLVWVLGIVILFADAYAFLCAASETEGSWGESGFTFGAFMLTIGYVAMVVAMSYFCLVLKSRLDALTAKE